MKNEKQIKSGVISEIKDSNKQSNSNQVSSSYDQRGTSKVWQFFCSVKLAVVIILVLVVACILGTVILQERTLDEYTAKYVFQDYSA